MVEAVLRAAGPYSLRLTAGTSTWTARLAGERWASAQQLPDGRVDRPRVGRARGRRGALHARARRRHERVPPAVRARPAARPDRATTARDANAAQGDGDARGRPSGRAVSSSRRRRRSRSSARSSAAAARIRRHARRSQASLPLDSRATGSPRAVPRRSRGSPAASTSRGCASGPTTPRARLERERGVGPWTRRGRRPARARPLRRRPRRRPRRS